MLCSFGRLPMVYTCLCCEMEMEVTSFRLVRIGLGGGGNWERGGIWGRGRDEGAYLEDQQRVVYSRRAARGMERFLRRDGRVEVSLHGRVHWGDRASDSFRVPTGGASTHLYRQPVRVPDEPVKYPHEERARVPSHRSSPARPARPGLSLRRRERD